MSDQNIAPELLDQIQKQETTRFQQWQEQQANAYLNSRVIELAAENHELRESLAELKVSSTQNIAVEGHVVE